MVRGGEPPVPTSGFWLLPDSICARSRHSHRKESFRSLKLRQHVQFNATSVTISAFLSFPLGKELEMGTIGTQRRI